MTWLTKVALWTVRLTGPTQVVLGLLFWSGHAYPLVRLHMLIGLAFTIGVLLLAVAAAWAGLRWMPATLSIALGLLVPVFGMTQTRLLPGPSHWVVKLAHLLLGIAAMGVAARLARFTQASRRYAVASGPTLSPEPGRHQRHRGGAHQRGGEPA